MDTYLCFQLPIYLDMHLHMFLQILLVLHKNIHLHIQVCQSGFGDKVYKFLLSWHRTQAHYRVNRQKVKGEQW